MTKPPILLTEAAWVEVASGSPCTIQAQLGRVWVRHGASAPPVSPATAFIGGREYDGHLIGTIKTDASSLGYAGSENTYARAVTTDGAVIVVSETI